MLTLLNGKGTIITVYYYVLLLCAQSTSGSCGYPDVEERLFTTQGQCETMANSVYKNYGRYLCKQVRYTIDIGHPYEGASEFYKSMVK